jgi:two-component sensor histidine kinase/PAS domain-containing protein
MKHSETSAMIWALDRLDFDSSPMDGMSQNALRFSSTDDSLNYDVNDHKHLFNSLPSSIIYIDQNGRIMDANNASEQLLGIQVKKLLTLSINDLDWMYVQENGTITSLDPEVFKRAFKDSKGIQKLKVGIYNKDTEQYHWMWITIVPISGTKQINSPTAYITFDNVTQEYQQIFNYRSLFKYMIDGCSVFEVNIDQHDHVKDLKLLATNSAFETLTGIETQELSGKSLKKMTDNEIRSWYKYLKEVYEQDSPVQFDFVNPKTSQVLSVNAFPAGKQLIGCVITDMTDRIKTQELIQKQLVEKEILLKEVHHRIKNNLLTIEGLLLLHAEEADNSDTINGLKDAVGRVKSMRLIYDKLLIKDGYQKVSSKIYLTDLIEAIVNLYPLRRSISVNKEILDLPMYVYQLFPLGVIVNELLTDVMKHAFTGLKQGHIWIKLNKSEDQITLMVKDDGVGFPDGFNIKDSKGFGMMLIDMLIGQLGGSISIENHHGVTSTVTFKYVN